jgi:hypothetical protein
MSMTISLLATARCWWATVRAGAVAATGYGRVKRLMAEGRMGEAYGLAEGILVALRRPGVNRGNPSIQSTFVYTTLALDDAATALGKPGASRQSLEEALSFCEIAGAVPPAFRAVHETLRRRLTRGAAEPPAD